MFTRFMDMHSGGRTKEPPFEYIYIEAGEEEAKVIFYNRFGHSAERVTCTCCGEDYSVSEAVSLEIASGYDRGCKWDKATRNFDPLTGNVSIGDYCSRPDVLVIRTNEIKDEERLGRVPEQGYYWVD
jgi:hypothetical protein